MAQKGEHAAGARQTAPSFSRSQKATVALLAAYVTFQLLFPFRHHLYPGEVSWTEEGHQFSWHMKLRDKMAWTRFFVTDPATKETWPVDIDDYLTSWQSGEMPGEPELILQVAHYLADRFRQDGYGRVEVRVLAEASLNGRRRQLLVDPTVDLTTKRRELWPPADWIIPLSEPLR